MLAEIFMRDNFYGVIYKTTASTFPYVMDLSNVEKD